MKEGNYCKAIGHVIKECPKVAANEASMVVVVNAFTSNVKYASVV